MEMRWAEISEPEGWAPSGSSRLLISLAVHAIIVVFLVYTPAPPAPSASPGGPLDVELLPAEPDSAPPQRETVTVMPPPNATAADLAPPPATPVPDAKQVIRQDPDLIRPTTMLSAQILANSASREGRSMLMALAEPERIEQLCGLEAMEQIRVWGHGYQPEQLVAYAFAEPTRSGNRFEAAGAAIRSKRKWYKVLFRCDVTSDARSVAAFEFKLGAPVPPGEWEEHGLSLE